MDETSEMTKIKDVQFVSSLCPVVEKKLETLFNFHQYDNVGCCTPPPPKKIKRGSPNSFCQPSERKPQFKKNLVLHRNQPVQLCCAQSKTTPNFTGNFSEHK